MSRIEERYPNGLLKSVAIAVDGVLGGEKKYYYPDQSIKAIETYNNGQLDGDYISYYRDSLIIHEKGQYRNGLMDGFWELYNSKGEKVKITTYENGVLVNEENPMVYTKTKLRQMGYSDLFN